jgi:magnesium chelatase subunit D
VSNPGSLSPLSLSDSVTRLLACAAISPGLRSILFFNTTPDALRLSAQTIVQMLEIVTKHPVAVVTLGTSETEDDLWGNWALNQELGEKPLHWKSGLLFQPFTKVPYSRYIPYEYISPLQLAVIPDLTKVTLAAARACVSLMGSDVAHLERHGQQAHCQPNICWIAGCASREIGMVSPHLLDRFALRISGEVAKHTDRATSILEFLDEPNLKETKPLQPLPVEIRRRILKALQIHPKMTDEAIARILDYSLEVEVFSPRREIALARLSLANARLVGAGRVTVDHVDTVAGMIGLIRDINRRNQRLDAMEKPQNEVSISTEVISSSTLSLLQEPESSVEQDSIYQSDDSEDLPATSLTFNANPVNPYPEDEAPVERDSASLRLPPRRFRLSTITRGHVIGVEKATNLQDLALVRTLLEAAKFQPIRQQSTRDCQKRLVLLATDLHSYRRAPVAEQMLMLVIDHTCLRNCNWQEELLPYLNWAYVERASVCLIQVGAADASHELRADKVMAQNILVPSISAGLEGEPGKATPLAHGLDLALHTLRHALQHGRNRIQQAVLIVISDGRGNVPLEASRLGLVTQPVGRQGVEDALSVAERIRGLDGVKAVLLNPQPKQYAALPLELAKALGAIVVEIPPLVDLNEK